MTCRAAVGAAGGDPVFAAFCAAGLWPGLGKRTAAELPAAGITAPGRRHRRPADQAAPGRPAAGRAAVLQLPGRARPPTRWSSCWSAPGCRRKLAAGVADALGPDAARRLRDDPWALLGLPGVTLGDADRLAIAVLQGADRQDTRRGRAIVALTLRTATRDGHTVLPADLVVAALQAEGIADPVGRDRRRGRVRRRARARAARAGGPGRRARPGAAHAVAGPLRHGRGAGRGGVVRLAATAERIADPASVRTVAKGLDKASRPRRSRRCWAHGVSLLTGGPGTGKSRTVAAIVKLLRAKGTDVALAAPTGRAAKRLEELTDHPAVTVHRLLGAQGTTGGFARNEEWPLDADVIVVDEASMLDVELTAALLEACPDGTHLLLVGDPAQLPSIGPGHVLGDLIDSGVVPVTELTTLYRQAEGGAIARLATAVRGGELPPVDSPDREVVVVPATGSAPRRPGGSSSWSPTRSRGRWASSRARCRW